MNQVGNVFCIGAAFSTAPVPLPATALAGDHDDDENLVFAAIVVPHRQLEFIHSRHRAGVRLGVRDGGGRKAAIGCRSRVNIRPRSRLAKKAECVRLRTVLGSSLGSRSDFRTIRTRLRTTLPQLRTVLPRHRTTVLRRGTTVLGSGHPPPNIARLSPVAGQQSIVSGRSSPVPGQSASVGGQRSRPPDDCPETDSGCPESDSGGRRRRSKGVNMKSGDPESGLRMPQTASDRSESGGAGREGDHARQNRDHLVSSSKKKRWPPDAGALGLGSSEAYVGATSSAPPSGSARAARSRRGPSSPA